MDAMKAYVNLLPPEIRRRSLSIHLRRCWYKLAIALLILGLLSLIPYRATQKWLHHQVLELQPIAKKSFVLQQKLDTLRRETYRIQSAQSQHLSMTGRYPPLAALVTLSEFCARHPKSIQILSFDYSYNRFPKREELPADILGQEDDAAIKQNMAASQTSNDPLGTLTIRAELTDPALATDLLSHLKATKLFKEVTLLNHNVDRENEIYSSSIDLACKF
jgi:hypothetical protein